MTIHILRKMNKEGGDVPIGVGLTLDDAAKLVPDADNVSIQQISSSFNRYIFKANDNFYMITPINVVGCPRDITIVSKVHQGFSDAEAIESIVDCYAAAINFVSKMGEITSRERGGRTLRLEVKVPVTKTIEENKVEIYFIREFPIKGVDEE